jgi:predicted lipoprotein with Yx(FWY)xxD motif
MRSPALLAALIALAAATAPVTTAAGPAPVVKLQTRPFGTVLGTRGHKALYWWTTEKRAGYAIRCTGSCAKLWPPLIVAAGTKVAARRTGFHGRFGTIRRPDGRLQVTYDRKPLYSYLHDPVGKVLCDDVDGWFVARA